MKLCIVVGAEIVLDPKVKLDAKGQSLLLAQARLDVGEAVRRALRDYEGSVDIQSQGALEG
jgi:hypothetical protein